MTSLHSIGLVGAALTTVVAGALAPWSGTALADAPGPTTDHRPAEISSPMLPGQRQSPSDGTEHSPAAKDASLAMRDLFASLPRLRGAERRQAEAALARPTDGTGQHGDPYGDGYTVQEALPLCGAHVCVHYVKSTSEAPPRADSDKDGYWDQVEQTLRTMESVWNYEVGTRGYRPPASDKDGVGDIGISDSDPTGAKFDVYLADIGDVGYYGYCAPEYYVAGQPHRASGYCVLDNDYATSQFGAPPLNSLRVTAAHEFFHAIQFNYDFEEDHWLMEATATWMEERYADAVNDNRQYLRYGQLRAPGTPLDAFNGSLAPYGNWIFFERLSQRFGIDSVRAIWAKLGASGSRRGFASTLGVKSYLAGKGVTFNRFYADFGAGNLFPDSTYSEGSAYPYAPVATTWSFSNKARFLPWQSIRLNHLTNRNVAFVHQDSMSGAWKLRVQVNGPALYQGTGAYVIVVRRSGALVRKPVSLNKDGDGSVTVAFSPATIAGVTLTLANGSTRFRCWHGTFYTCHGTPLDNSRSFSYKATAVR